MGLLSLKSATRLLLDGKLTVLEIYEKCLKAASRTKELNAFITQTDDLSSHQAQQAHQRYEKGRPNGPLDGIPVAVKDNFCTDGIHTTCASNMLREYKPPYNATVVQKLLDQGSVLMGKTNLDEFGMGCGGVDSVHGPMRNPWCYTPDDWHISGGSSGGSAVAVATGAAFVALSSDTGGSTRNPASYCGVVGLSPTYGTLSRHGLIPLVNSCDIPGIMGRNVDDVSTAFSILAGHDPLDSTTVRHALDKLELPDDISLEGVHVGIPKEYYPPSLSEDTYKAWQSTADTLESLGCKVSQVSLPHTHYSLSCYSVICACDVASNMAKYDGIQFGHRSPVETSTEALFATSRHEGFNDVVRGRILAGNYFLLKEHYDDYFVQAMKVRRLIADDFRSVFNSGVDVLLTPTILSGAPPYKEFATQDNRTRTQEQDVFTQPVNLADLILLYAHRVNCHCTQTV